MSTNSFRVKNSLVLNPGAEPVSPEEGEIYYDSTAEKIKKYESGAWKNLASGGTGVKNLLTEENSKLESGISDWLTYKDAASSQPVDGTGGSPTVISTNVTTVSNEILEGLKSLKLSKSASNGQGEGISVLSQTVDSADRGKPMYVYFSYDATDINYVYGDLQVFAYDVTNSKLLTVYNDDDNGKLSQQKGQFSGIFFTENTTDSIRLIIHCASTNATSYEVFVDEVVITPQTNLLSSIVSNWTNFPSVAAGTLITASTTSPTYGTVTTNSARWRRVGENMEIEWRFQQTTAGSAGSGDYLFNLPAGYAIDLTKIEAQANNSVTGYTKGVVGHFYDMIDAASDQISLGLVAAYDSTRLKVYFSTVTTAQSTDCAPWTNASHHFGVANIGFVIKASVPIVGWSSGAITSSNDTGLKTVRVFAYKTTGNSTADADMGNFNSPSVDNYNAFNSTTGVFTVPKSASYHFSCQFAGTVSGSGYGYITVNGTEVLRGAIDNSLALYGINGFVPNLKKGDQVTFRVSVAKTLSTANPASFFSAYSLPDFNTFGVQGPIVVGAITDWADAGAVTIGATTTAPTKPSGIENDKVRWRRVGDSMEIRISYVQSNTTGAAAGSGDYLFSIPGGYQIDTTKITAYSTVEGAAGSDAWLPKNTVGIFSAANQATGGTAVTGSVVVYDSNKVRFFGVGSTSTPSVTIGVVGSSLFPLNGNATTTYSAKFTVPIVGWSSETRLYPTQRVMGTVYLKDVKPSGTAGGTFTSGSYQTRILNTMEGDTGFCSLSANQFTLQPGTYELWASAPVAAINNTSLGPNRHKARLRNVTAGTTILLGTSEGLQTNVASGTLVTGKSQIQGRVTITSPTVFEIQHQCTATTSTIGFGVETSFGDDEIYTIVKIDKIY